MNPVVFLHGFLGGTEDWHAVIRGIHDQVTVALPLPRASDWRSAVASVLNALPERSVLVGYSMGARLALGCLVAAPERIRHVFFIAGHPGLSDPERHERRLQDAKLMDDLRQLPFDQFLDQWYRQPLFDNVPQSTKHEWIQQRLTLNVTEQIEILRGLSISNQPNYWPQLTRIGQALTVVVGDVDQKYLAVGRRIIEQAPSAQLEVISGAGHAIPRERPAAIARLLSHALRGRHAGARIDASEISGAD